MAKTGKRSATRRFPRALLDEATEGRQHMLEALSMYSDELMELLLSEEEVSQDLIHKVLREAVKSGRDHAGPVGDGVSQQRCAAAVGCRDPLPSFTVGT